MPAERYFADDDFSLNQSFSLKGPEFHHLAHVMRAREGEEVELVNGRGSLAQAVVKTIRKEEALLLITDVQIQPARPRQVILAQGMPKPNRLDFILEKGAELGVDEFWLFPGQRSVKKDFSINQMERSRALIGAAMKQCGRLFLPKLTIKPELKKWPIPLEGTAFFGDVDPTAPLFANAWQTSALSSPLFFFVGPESGLSPEEIEELKKRQARGVKLNENILRADTAALTALSLIEHWLLR